MTEFDAIMKTAIANTRAEYVGPLYYEAMYEGEDFWEILEAKTLEEAREEATELGEGVAFTLRAMYGKEVS